MWLITKDFFPVPGTKSRVGFSSPGYSEEKRDQLIYQFRMLDDDKNVYYAGLSSDCESESAFNPLDDLGMPDAGCTEIQYMRAGKWETL